MCGIAGCVNFKKAPSSDVARMVSFIRHRGPDAQKTFAQGPIHFGHARLRILDLDPKADQPFFNESKDKVVVFNGEIYNYKDIRAALPETTFRTNCDTEVILAAYEKWGEACVERFNGMFAFVLFDFTKGLAFGARDRFGVKPLYYAQSGDAFLFASEIKAILAARPESAPNEKAILEYIGTDCCEHRADTFFKGVQQLLPGEAFALDAQGLRLSRYYDFKDKPRQTTPLSPEQAAQGMRDLLRSSVAYRVQSDVPVGLYYSGGIDSNAVAAVLRDNPGGEPMRSLTAFSDDVPDSERRLIKDMAESLGLVPSFCDSTVENAAAYLRQTMWHMEMPFSPSLACDDALNKAARERNLVVVLEGQGSDEAQAGYLRYYLPFLHDCLRAARFGALLDGLAHPPAPLTPKKALRDLFRRVVKTALTSCGLARSAKRGFLPARYDGGLIAKAGAPLPDAIPQPFRSQLDNAMLQDAYMKLQRVFRYKDRISMAYSRELRVPFLDYRIFEFMAALPNDRKIKTGVQKLVLRDAMKGLIPPEACQIPKNHLLKDKISASTMAALRRELETILDTPQARRRGLFDVEAVLKDWRAGTMPSSLFWRIGQVELWFRLFADLPLDEAARYAVQPIVPKT